MDKEIKEYFCIFCNKTFDSSDNAYKHYKTHLGFSYYCTICDSSPNISNKLNKHRLVRCDRNHQFETKSVNLKSEIITIEMWIERLLAYQTQIKNKKWKSLSLNSKFFNYCPVCDAINKICGIDIEKVDDPNMMANSSNLKVESPFRTQLTIHVNSHLSYFPYECGQCEAMGKLTRKPDLTEITKHLKKAHGKLLKNYETSNMIKKVKITKLERFLSFYFKSSFNDYNKINNYQISEDNHALEIPEKRIKLNHDVTMIKTENNHNNNELNELFTEDDLRILKLDESSIDLINDDDNNFNNNDGETLMNQDQIDSKIGSKLILATESLRNIRSIIGPDYFTERFVNIIDEEEVKRLNDVQKTVEYFCVFCEKKFDDKKETYRHYQNHLEYFPITCQLCGYHLTDLDAFLDHHKKHHPKTMKGKYRKKEQKIIDKWISGFLYSQSTAIVKSFPAREQCPVCKILFTPEEIGAQKPRRCTINRKIDHLHRHLCYLPYECLKCKENGCEFSVAYFESKAHSHIKQKHPEIDDDESRWDIFQKAVSIPKLDEFVKNYLWQYGISMDVERRPVKKKLQMLPTQHPQQILQSMQQSHIKESSLSPIYLPKTIKTATTSSPPKFSNEIQVPQNFLDLMFSGIVNMRDNCGARNLVQLSDGNQVELILPDKTNDDLIIDNDDDVVIDDEEIDETGNVKFVVNVTPFVSENTSQRNFFCVFCPMKFKTKMDAYHHYGEHLEYMPVSCKLCDNKFSDTEALTQHYCNDHPYETDIASEVSEDDILMKWVDDFLDFQINSSIRLKAITCPCSNSCPVCQKIKQIKTYAASATSTASSSSSLTKSLTTTTTSTLFASYCHEHNDIAFSDHIHQHLLYFPYECVMCKSFGKTVRVPNLDIMAMNHVKVEHNINNASMYQLCKTFPKTLIIPKLEKFILEHVNQKRMIDKKGKSADNLQIKQQMEEINMINNNLLIEKETENNNNARKKTFKHARVENGRIINLPPLSDGNKSKFNNNSPKLLNNKTI